MKNQSVLTVEVLEEVYLSLFDFPEEKNMYVCHSDTFTSIREVFNEEVWGTCPIFIRHDSCPVGQILEMPKSIIYPELCIYQQGPTND